MQKLRIIYTPNADRFRLRFPSTHFSVYKGDSETVAMRQAYAGLRERMGGLPETVGVVTYPEIAKWHVEDMRKEMAEHGIKSPTTTYLPLDIMDAVMKLRDEDVGNTLTEQYVCRQATLLCSHQAVLCDEGVPPRVNSSILFGPSIPKADYFMHKLKQFADDKKHKKKLKKISMGLGHMMQDLGKIGTWKNLEMAKRHFYARFAANRVSRELPLCFIVPGAFPAELVSVGLDDRLEEPRLPRMLEGALRHWCKANENRAYAERILAETKNAAKDFFGRTEQFDLLERLLEALPGPKTIITDTYIVDALPKLRKMGFESAAYNP
jgi:hypothetical protein